MNSFLWLICESYIAQFSWIASRPWTLLCSSYYHITSKSNTEWNTFHIWIKIYDRSIARHSLLGMSPSTIQLCLSKILLINPGLTMVIRYTNLRIIFTDISPIMSWVFSFSCLASELAMHHHWSILIGPTVLQKGLKLVIAWFIRTALFAVVFHNEIVMGYRLRQNKKSAEWDAYLPKVHCRKQNLQISSLICKWWSTCLLHVHLVLQVKTI